MTARYQICNTPQHLPINVVLATEVGIVVLMPSTNAAPEDFLLGRRCKDGDDSGIASGQRVGFIDRRFVDVTVDSTQGLPPHRDDDDRQQHGPGTEEIG